MNRQIMKELGYDIQVARIEQGLRPLCEQPVTRADLKDDLSRKEFDISGMCQKCQDNTFGGGSDGNM